MGLMDNFTSDSPVTVKQPDYYAMIKEAAKAELITNAVYAGVPWPYIRAMIDGKPVTPEELGWRALYPTKDFIPHEGMTAEEKESEGIHDNKCGSSTEAEERNI